MAVEMDPGCVDVVSEMEKNDGELENVNDDSFPHLRDKVDHDVSAASNRPTSEMIMPKQPLLGMPKKASLTVRYENSQETQHKPTLLLLCNEYLICAKVTESTLSKHLENNYKRHFTNSVGLDDELTPHSTRRWTLNEGFLFDLFNRNRKYKLIWFAPVTKIKDICAAELQWGQMAIDTHINDLKSVNRDLDQAKQLVASEPYLTEDMNKQQLRNLCRLLVKLACTSPHVPLSILLEDGTCHTLLLNSDHERAGWIQLVRHESDRLARQEGNGASAAKPERVVSGILRSMSSLQPINHVESILNIEKEVSGVVYIEITQLTGVPPLKHCYVNIESDSHGQPVLVAMSQICSSDQTGTVNLNETHFMEVNHCTFLYVSVYVEKDLAAYLQLPINADLEVNPQKATHRLLTYDDLPSAVEMKLSLYFTTNAPEPFNDQDHIIGFTLDEMLEHDYARDEALRSAFKQTRWANSIASRERSLVPQFVQLCASEIERRAMTTVGVYRIVPSFTTKQNLISIFDQGGLRKGLQFMDLFDAPVLAGIFKTFFDELKDSLTRTDSLKVLSEIINAGEAEAVKNGKILGVLLQLQPPVLATLVYLLRHIIRISKYAEVNKMSLDNLSRVWAYYIFPINKKDTNRTNRLTRDLSIPSDSVGNGQVTMPTTALMGVPTHMQPVHVLHAIVKALDEGRLVIPSEAIKRTSGV